MKPSTIVYVGIFELYGHAINLVGKELVHRNVYSVLVKVDRVHRNGSTIINLHLKDSFSLEVKEKPLFQIFLSQSTALID